MAMFGSGSTKKGGPIQATTATPVARESAGTVIGSTVRVEGQFTSEDNVLIEGQVHGTLTTTQNLTVGSNARIEADIHATNMYISGEIHGNIIATGSVQLTSTARVYGDIETSIISIETGAVVQGRCTTSGELSEPMHASSDEMDTDELDTDKEEAK